MNSKQSISLASVGRAFFQYPLKKKIASVGFSSENGISFPEAQKCLGVISFPWCFMWVFWTFCEPTGSQQLVSCANQASISACQMCHWTWLPPESELAYFCQGSTHHSWLAQLQLIVTQPYHQLLRKAAQTPSVGSLKRVARPDCKPVLLDSSYFPHLLHLQREDNTDECLWFPSSLKSLF